MNHLNLTHKKKLFQTLNIIERFFDQNFLIACKNNDSSGYEYNSQESFIFNHNPLSFLPQDHLINIRFLCDFKYFKQTNCLTHFNEKGFEQKNSPLFFMLPYFSHETEKKQNLNEPCVSFTFGCEIKFTLVNEDLNFNFYEYNKENENKYKKVIEILENELSLSSTSLQAVNLPNENYIKPDLTSTLPQEKIEKNIYKLMEHMIKGESYLANYTYTQYFDKSQNECLFNANYFLQNWLNSTPQFGFYFDTQELGLSCYSPERFLLKKNNQIFTEPIKGTVRKNKYLTKQNNLQTLWQNQKEIHEHTLVVDLLRNDLNAVCTPGSVHVQQPFFIKECPTLFHMQSTIFGSLKNNISTADLFARTLPCGSVTGTPKKKTCQLIETYEEQKRGFYTGTAGLIEANGSFDSCVLIRSVFKSNLGIYAGVGAGITTLSNPKCEIEELKLKLSSFLQ